MVDFKQKGGLLNFCSDVSLVINHGNYSYTGWWGLPSPLKKYMSSSVGVTERTKNKCSKPPTSMYIYIYISSIIPSYWSYVHQVS